MYYFNCNICFSKYVKVHRTQTLYEKNKTIFIERLQINNHMSIYKL